MGPVKKHVVIIGAGISGLAAAHELSKHPSSIQVTVLEARNRIGGRLDTHRNLFSGEHQDIPIDFGASWIHGVNPSNPMVSLAEAAGARLEATNSDVIYDRPGHVELKEDESNHYWAVLWDIFGRAQEYSRDNRKHISINTSFRKWLDHFLSTRQSKDPRLPNYMSRRELKIVPLLAQFWADENAIPLDKVSLKYMDAEDMPPGDHCIMANGYDRVLDVLCKDMGSVDIRLEHVVDRIEYNESNVKISTNKGLFTADVVLVTLPLGVLKSNSVTFSPPLPERKQMAIKRLGFGTMVKVVLHFPTCFWPKDKHFINFLPIPSSIPNPKICRHLNERQMKALTTYMNDLANYTSLMPIHNAPIMIAYMANDSAEVFEKLSEEEAMEVLVCQLSHYFDVLINDPASSRPTQVFMSRWNTDPYARGSYTSIPVGAHQSDLAEFEVPVGARSVIVLSRSEHESSRVEACIEDLAVKTNNNSLRPFRKLSEIRADKMKNLSGSNPMKTLIPISYTTNATHHHLSQFVGLPQVNSIEGSVGRRLGRNSTSKVHNHSSHGRIIHPNRVASAVSLHHRMDLRGPSAGVMMTHGPFHTDGSTLDLQFGDDGRIPMICTKDQQQQQLLTMPLSELDPLVVSNSNMNGNRGYVSQQEQQQDSELVRKKSAAATMTTTTPATLSIIKTIAVDDAVQGRIHFAGEHTTPTSFASVHGALMTGRREAAKILAQAF
ncbi:hypothetical protein EDD11_000190 [Mortierella claussenii]|nr:hypothetical protein EDD11_000190 [Mortierella claussenii]